MYNQCIVVLSLSSIIAKLSFAMHLIALSELRSEDKCMTHLRQYGILLPDKDCDFCGTKMREWNRVRKGNRKLPYLRCPKGSCRKSIPLRSLSPFFGPLGCRLRLHEVFELVYLFLYVDMPLSKVNLMTKRGKSTIHTWWKKCRDVCRKVIALEPKLRGTFTAPVQVDESYFAGRRKYNRGRLLARDKRNPAEEAARLEMDMSDILGWGKDRVPIQKEEANLRSGRNYGRRIVGPWVVGLYQSRTNVRFVVVPDRKKATLHDIVRRFVEPDSSIHTDEWVGYKGLNDIGYMHNVVNHSQNYVDPVTGVHTQNIERAWVEEKKWMKSSHGSVVHLQDRLDEAAWRRLRDGHPGGLMHAFLIDLKRVDI